MDLLKTNLLLVAALFITSCSSKPGQQTDIINPGDHGHETGQQFTLFSDKIEFFVEFPQLAEGHEASFYIHLTALENYKPISQGTVSVSLENDSGKIRESSSDPIRAGIYRVDVSPEKAGPANIHFSYTGDEMTSEVSTGEVRIFSSEEDAHADGEDAGQEITFTKENAWNSDFMVSLFEPAPFASIIKAGGEILALPGEKHYVHAPSSGIVQFSRENMVAGTTVLAGEELISVKGEGLARDNISVDFAGAGTRFYRSKSDFERKRNLLAENAVSEKDFIESHSVYLIDSIYFHNLQRSFEDGGLKIVAPIDGYIHDMAVSEGEYVAAGQLVATISSDRWLLLRADVPQQYFDRIRSIVSTHFRTSYSREVMDIQSMEGRLLAIGSSVAENNHFLPVYFVAMNKGNLLEGAFVEFYLITSTEENAIAVPKSALTEEQGRYFVYVQTAGESYLKREVFIGDSDGLKTRVEGGLSPGERVVTRGSMLLKTASVSSSIPEHSHEH